MAANKPGSKGPQFVRYFGPVLDALRNLGGSGRPSEVESNIVMALNITAEEQSETTKSGQSKVGN